MVIYLYHHSQLKQNQMKKMSFSQKGLLVVLLSIFVMVLMSSCSRYIVERQGGGCGVWYPKKYNPNKGSRWENPRGHAGYGSGW